MMLAKSLLIRPEVAALCMVSGRTLVLSFIQGKTTTLKRHISSCRGLCLEMQLHPCGPAASFTYCCRAFCIRAASNSENSVHIESPLMKSMEKKIKEQLGAESVVVEDAYGDGRHVSIDVISSAFEGQSSVNRQRMVYKAIWEELQDTVHAVDKMITRTPSEAASGN